ncbi:MAG: putative rane protein [Herbinix sp.]|jgi:stage III sporulation protein AC|nr:putative rane protein [Herbinix sp.]
MTEQNTLTISIPSGFKLTTGKGLGVTMDIYLILRIAVVGILVSILNNVLKHSGRDDQAFLVGLAGMILVLFWLLPYVSELFETITKLFEI